MSSSAPNSPLTQLGTEGESDTGSSDDSQEEQADYMEYEARQTPTSRPVLPGGYHIRWVLLSVFFQDDQESARVQQFVLDADRLRSDEWSALHACHDKCVFGDEIDFGDVRAFMKLVMTNTPHQTRKALALQGTMVAFRTVVRAS